MSNEALPRIRNGAVERVRKNHGADRLRLFKAVVNELHRFKNKARVPLDVFIAALECVKADAEDVMFVDCPSWAENPETPWHGGDRGRPGDPGNAD